MTFVGNWSVGLRIYCADRKINSARGQKSHRLGDFQWIFVRNGEGTEQLHLSKEKRKEDGDEDNCNN